MKLAYVDACAWITMVEGLDRYQPKVRRALKGLALNNWVFCTSDAVRLEVLIGPLRRKQAPLATAYRAILETNSLLKTPKSIFADALSIAEAERLKAMDAVHIAIAHHYGCGRFVTTDPHFKSLSLLTPLWIDLANTNVSEGPIDEAVGADDAASRSGNPNSSDPG
ncbi:PilT protein domain protein [Thiocapsa marina 5811]|uniref:PilT protein domain protein n=2 Tax=Thiocapsa marina TaxID=244573 RepID=F9UGK3_9GAMM|nr:PilT protein domain protein [Thiocapsa marina 5811]